jgi:hypothetical protein
LLVDLSRMAHRLFKQLRAQEDGERTPKFFKGEVAAKWTAPAVSGRLPRLAKPIERGPSRLTWIVALAAFREAASVEDALLAVYRVEAFLADCEAAQRETLAREFAHEAEEKQSSNPTLFVQQLVDLLATVKPCDAQSNELSETLRPALMREVMLFLSLAELGCIASVSQEWRALSEHNFLWRQPYLSRFGFHEPAQELSPTSSSSTALAAAQPLYKEFFAQRLVNPQVKDRVEVAWRGKFRLESLEIYSGLAW